MTGANGSASADLVAALGELAEVQAQNKVDAGPIKYTYADLATIMTTVRPILAKHNLAVTQLVSSTHEGELLVRTVLLHGSGVEFDMDPLGAKMPVTPQQVGSFISYFRRYQLTSRLGIAVEDDDGQAASKAKQDAEKREETPPKADPQTKKAMALFDRLEIKGREQRLAVMSAILGRKIGSWTTVAPKERGSVIDDLERRLSVAEVAVRQADADDRLERDLLAAAADPDGGKVARYDTQADTEDEPRIDSDLDDIHDDIGDRKHRG